MMDLCVRMARYKKENKELLAYLLFQAHDEQAYIGDIKTEADALFSQLPRQSYFMMKTLRKILRLLNKHIKFAGVKSTEIELLMYFCKQYLNYADLKANYKPLRTIFIRQLEKVKGGINKLHEDVQLDFTTDYEELLSDAQKKLSWFKINEFRL